jgi:hypothetical protein
MFERGPMVRCARRCGRARERRGGGGARARRLAPLARLPAGARGSAWPIDAPAMPPRAVKSSAQGQGGQGLWAGAFGGAGVQGCLRWAMAAVRHRRPIDREPAAPPLPARSCFLARSERPPARRGHTPLHRVPLLRQRRLRQHTGAAAALGTMQLLVRFGGAHGTVVVDVSPSATVADTVAQAARRAWGPDAAAGVAELVRGEPPWRASLARRGPADLRRHRPCAWRWLGGRCQECSDSALSQPGGGGGWLGDACRPAGVCAAPALLAGLLWPPGLRWPAVRPCCRPGLLSRGLLGPPSWEGRHPRSARHPPARAVSGPVPHVSTCGVCAGCSGCVACAAAPPGGRCRPGAAPQL